MNKYPILIADIGGTNARFALVDESDQQFYGIQTLEAADFTKLTDAIDLYLQSHSIEQLESINLAVAGPIHNEQVKFPNSHWQVNCQELRSKYRIEKANLLNDWEAIAYSLSGFTEQDLIKLGTKNVPIKSDNYCFGAIGPGSGLGVSGLICRNNNLAPIVTEGGHVGFAPENQYQGQVLKYLQQKYDGRVSRERLLSGPGIVNIYEALCSIHGVENQGLTAASIANLGLAKTEQEAEDAICAEAFALFFEILGQAAGDIALDMGAYDGVFIAGGICQRYPDHLVSSYFRRGFENKGRHSEIMQQIPCWLITHPNPGLLGASIFAKTTL